MLLLFMLPRLFARVMPVAYSLSVTLFAMRLALHVYHLIRQMLIFA